VRILPRLKHIVKPVVSAAVTSWSRDDDGQVALVTRRGPAKGLRFHVDLIRRQEYGYWLGTYDRPILQSIARLCRPGWTAWDCGTYLGYYTCFLARLVGPEGRVAAFEPDPINLARTERNVTLNGFRNVSFHHVAVGPPTGTIELRMGEHTNSHIPGVYVGASRDAYALIESVSRTITVPATSLDDAWSSGRAPRPNLIKLDIEGAELIALEHADRLCREVRPIVVLELHNPECDLAAWRWAATYDYRLQSLVTGRMLTRQEDVGGTLLCTPAQGVTNAVA
jgi:FkbM family methyltransferase